MKKATAYFKKLFLKISMYCINRFACLVLKARCQISDKTARIFKTIWEQLRSTASSETRKK